LFLTEHIGGYEIELIRIISFLKEKKSFQCCFPNAIAIDNDIIVNANYKSNVTTIHASEQLTTVPLPFNQFFSASLPRPLIPYFANAKGG